MKAYLPILQALQMANVKFAIIGTTALKHYLPTQLANYDLPDCDLVLQPAQENILLAFQTLQNAGWQMELWGEDLYSAPTAEQLQGKFYLRAKQSNLVLDMTYECPIAWNEIGKGIQVEDGLPLACIDDVLKLKRMKGKASDWELLRRLGM